MTNDHENIFSRAMMTGLFIGVVDTIICLGYNIGYRDMTGYTPSALINVSSLIFAVNLLMLFIGIVYFLFIRLFARRDIVFVLFFSCCDLGLRLEDGGGPSLCRLFVQYGVQGVVIGHRSDPGGQCSVDTSFLSQQILRQIYIMIYERTSSLTSRETSVNA